MKISDQGSPLQAAGSHERVVGAVFEGSGDLRLAPTLGMERQQLAFHSKEPVLQAEFERAFFMFTDDTAQELEGQLKFGEGNSAQLEKHYREWIKKLQRYGRDWTPRLLKGLLAEDPTQHAFFVAEICTQGKVSTSSTFTLTCTAWRRREVGAETTALFSPSVC